MLDPILPAACFAGFGDERVLVFLIARIHVHRDQREANRRPLPQDIERLHQCPAVFAAGQADHDAVAVFEHRVVNDRFGGLLGQPGFEFGAISHTFIHSI